MEPLQQPLLICLIGAECTGKTTLAQALAQQLHGLWVPEYLRSFTEQHGRTPRHDEQMHILQQQLQWETQAVERAQAQQLPWVFGDTAPLLTAVYSDCVFADASLYAHASALHARYALTLLLEPDFAWQADGLQRDGDSMRTRVHHAIEQVLAQHAWPCVRIGGTPAERLHGALHAVSCATNATNATNATTGG